MSFTGELNVEASYFQIGERSVLILMADVISLGYVK